jgi:hypothetical protein
MFVCIIEEGGVNRIGQVALLSRLLVWFNREEVWKMSTHQRLPESKHFRLEQLT